MSNPSSGSSVNCSGDSGSPYGLDELLAIASNRLNEAITPRTVRLYTTEGLIDRPHKDGRRAVYSRRHLLQLLLIRSLAKRGLSLAAIAPLVTNSDSELEQQLLQLENYPLSTHSSRLEESGAAQRQEALAFLEEIKNADIGEDGTSSTVLPMLGSPFRSHGQPSVNSRSLPSRYPGRVNSASSRWYRFALVPGVELHLNESVSIPPAGSRRDAWLGRLLDRLREQLDGDS